MTQGFFTKKETESISAVGGKIHSCASCGLYKDCRSPKMRPWGKGEKGIMCIGEAPGQEEDNKGKPWQGPAGRLLRQTLSNLGIDLYRDCLSLNAVNCRPPDNRTPTVTEIDHCRSVIVWGVIQEFMPKAIIVFGGSALQTILGHRWNGAMKISKWRGWAAPDQELKSWVCPTFHPSYLLRMDKPSDYMRIWYRDIKQALEKSEVEFPRHKSPDIEVVDDLQFLNDYPHRLSAFDYETTGLKPQAEGHRIATCSIAGDAGHAWSFLIPKTREGRLPLRRWLANQDIPKVAQNAKFEDTWSREILKVPVKGWAWDTMLAAHVLDNRTGTNSLKFQTYVNFGIMGYEQEVSPYLKSDDEFGDNTKNNLLKLLRSRTGKKKVLEYNGLDAVYEYRLAIKQMEELDWDFLPF